MALNLDRVRAFVTRLRRGRGGVDLRRRTAALGTIAVVLLVSPSYPTGDAVALVEQGLMAWSSLLGVTLVLALALESAGWRRALRSRVLQWCGSRSFSIYLVHEPLIVALALFVHASTPWPWLPVMVAAIPGVLVIAEGFHRFVERPTLLLIGRLGRRRGSKWPLRDARSMPS